MQWDKNFTTRQFASRFGDIDKIEITGDDAADVTMRSGTVYAVSGSSNDVGAEITVWDQSLGEIALRWNRTERVRDHCRVKLRDGREIALDGTNDVDSSIRGILLEDPRYGRVEVTWDAFERVEFQENSSSGNGYDSYRPGSRLRATVTDADGEARTGQIYFDMDESESWEFLNGTLMDVEYNLPFSLVDLVEPQRRNAAKVTLRSGEILRLVDGQDVSENNDGILLLNDGDDDPVYLDWRDVDRIQFHW